MTLHTFKDKTAIIIGGLFGEITSDRSGVLTIGKQTVNVTANVPASLPMLTDGIKSVKLLSGEEVYTVGQVNVRYGRLVPQSYMSKSEIALKHRVDELEKNIALIFSELSRLDKKFDTNSLNFIIKGE